MIQEEAPVKTTREAELEAAEAPNPHADLIAWLNTESDRLDDAAAGDELAAEGLEVSSEGIELLRGRAELLSLAAEILEAGDAKIPPGAAVVCVQLRNLADGERGERRVMLARASDAVREAGGAVATYREPESAPFRPADLPAEWDRRAERHDREREALPEELAYACARTDKASLTRAHRHCARELRLANEKLAMDLEAKAAAADREAEHHNDYGRVCHCEGEAKAYRHAAELVRQAREGR